MTAQILEHPTKVRSELDALKAEVERLTRWQGYFNTGQDELREQMDRLNDMHRVEVDGLNEQLRPFLDTPYSYEPEPKLNARNINSILLVLVTWNFLQTVALAVTLWGH